MTLPSVVAHRGASHDLPEHTPAAYRLAIAAGAEAVECDVRLTADQHLVCVHDAGVERTSSGRGAVSRMTLDQLRELDWGSWRRRDAQDPLPEDGRTLLTLRDLFAMVDAAPRPVGVAVETKHPSRFGGEVEQALAALLEEFGWAGASGPVRMMSFSVLALRRMARLAPSLPLVYLMDRLPPPYRDGSLPGGAGTAGISLALLRRDPDYVRRAHALGHQVHVWTVDDEQDVDACVAAGVDAIITNRPREVLARLVR